MNRTARYLLAAVLALVFACCLALAWAGVKARRARTTCTGIEVQFRDELRFVTEGEIKDLLDRNYGIYLGQGIDSVQLSRIEQMLRTQTAIRAGEAWTTDDGVLHIGISQRKPVLRIQTENGGCYADAEGTVFPLRNGCTPLVPVIDGAVQSGQKEWLDGVLELVAYMHRTKVWEENIAQMHVLPSGDIVMIPRTGRERFLFGTPDHAAEKFKRMEQYYRHIRPAQEGSGYKSVNVKYQGQIICRK